MNSLHVSLDAVLDLNILRTDLLNTLWWILGFNEPAFFFFKDSYVFANYTD